MRRLPPLLACLALIAGCGDDSAPDQAGRSDGAQGAPAVEIPAELRGAPKPLAAVHRQANQLLDGGPEAFEARLAALRGYPVIVNKWASWCPPCREELPWFQEQALERGKQIAFLGVDANDNDGDAREFLAEFPVTYPSYRDPDLKVSAVFNAVQAFPATAFYDSGGELAYLKQGGYLDERDFVADIRRYAR